VAIYRLLQNPTFGPDEIRLIAAAFEGALIDLRLKDRDDPVTELVANKIFEQAQRGERDPQKLREAAVTEFRRK
jgi:hypothetical protein